MKNLLATLLIILLSSNALGANEVTMRSDEDLYILEVRLDKYILSEAISAYKNDQSAVIALSDMMILLEFAIKTNLDDRTAKGWFIAKDRKFFLDTANEEFSINGVRKKYSPDLLEIHRDDIYVDIRLLSQMFPVDFELLLNEQILAIKSREKLPFEKALEQSIKRNNISQQDIIKKQYPRIIDPYRLVSTPFSDLSFSSDYDSRLENSLSNSLSLVSEMDVGYMNSRLFLAANSNQGISDVKFTMQRKSNEADLLGAMQATEISIGDIFTDQLTLTARSSRGRGVEISNFPLGSSAEFDRITLQGEIQPNWDIELYRNNILLEFKKADSDGRYEFEDVPLLSGLNVMKFVFYGPFGEIREEIRRYLIDSNSIKPNDFYYKLNILQQSQDLFSVNEQNSVIQAQTIGDPRFTASFKKGVTKNLSLFAHFASLPINDNKRREYLTAGASGSARNILAKIGITKDISDAAAALSIDLQTKYNFINVTFSHNNFINGFISEYSGDVNNPLKQRSNLAFDGRIKLSKSHNINSSIALTRSIFESGLVENELRNRLSTSFYNFNISNYLTYNNNNISENRLNGNFLVNYFSGKLSLRSAVDYLLSPSSDIESLSLSADYNFAQDYNFRSEIAHAVQQGMTRYTVSLNQLFDSYRLGLSSFYEDDGEFGMGLSLSFSFGKNPQNDKFKILPPKFSQNAMIASRFFIDKDGDSKFSSKDELLENVRLKINNSTLKETSDDEGLLFLNNLRTDVVNIVEVDMSKVEDPYLIAKNAGFEVVGHSGVPVLIDFPIIPTGEIDGVVYLQNSASSRKELSNVEIQLLDINGKIVKTTKSAYDGFYLFEHVAPGEYTVRCSPKQLERLGYVSDERKPAKITASGNIVSAVDLIIKSNAETD